MKAIIIGIIIMFFISCSPATFAQGWNQDRNGIYSVGLGGASVIAVGPYYGGATAPGMSLNISGEYKVHRFIGVGFETGMDVFIWPYYAYAERPYRAHNVAIGIPIAVKCNIHILEAANLPIARKLDLYAGLNFGGGPAVYTAAPAGVFGFLEVGPQIGIRYWLNPSIAIFGEFGWGATFANIGFSF